MSDVFQPTYIAIVIFLLFMSVLSQKLIRWKMRFQNLHRHQFLLLFKKNKTKCIKCISLNAKQCKTRFDKSSERNRVFLLFKKLKMEEQITFYSKNFALSRWQELF